MVLEFGGCELDRQRLELRRDGEPVALEPRAMQLLLHLVDHRDRVVTKSELLDDLWGGRFVSESALSTQVKAVRRAIGDSGREQRLIKTVHGWGYRFVGHVRTDRDAAAPAVDDERDAAGGSPTESAADDERPVVAVSPLVDLIADDERHHVARGLTHDIIAALSKHRWLRVLTASLTGGTVGARGSSEHSQSIGRLREQFGVRYVVEGTVRLEGRRLRVTASLTDAAAGVCLWAERYDREFADLHDVLDEITDVVVATVEPELGAAERSRSSRRVTDLHIWDRFHLGIEHFFRFTSEGNHAARQILDDCRRLDPLFPDAHAWWAYAVVLGMVYWDADPKPELLDAAIDATGEALRHDDQNAIFHVLHGRVQLARREYHDALLANQRAIELNPTAAAAFCGLGDSLCYEGRYEEAMVHFERSVSLGSHDPQRWAFLTYGALALLFWGRYDEAVAWADRARPIPNCQYWTVAHRVVALAGSGRVREAAADVPQLLADCPRFSVDYATRKLFYLKRPDQLTGYLAGLRAAGVPETR